MTTPTFDTIEAQASYGIGLQVGQQLSEPEPIPAAPDDRHPQMQMHSAHCPFRLHLKKGPV